MYRLLVVLAISCPLVAMQSGTTMSAQKVALLTNASNNVFMENRIQQAADWLWQAYQGKRPKLSALRVFIYQRSDKDSYSQQFVQKPITNLDNLREFVHVRNNNFVWRHLLASTNPGDDDLLLLGTNDPILLQRLRVMLGTPDDGTRKYNLRLLHDRE